MLPGSILLADRADSNSFNVISAISKSFISGTICNCRPNMPVISTIATSGNCSILRLITVSANWQRSRKASSFSIVLSVRLRQNTGMSVALALTTRGRSTSRGR